MPDPARGSAVPAAVTTPPAVIRAAGAEKSIRPHGSAVVSGATNTGEAPGPSAARPTPAAATSAATTNTRQADTARPLREVRFPITMTDPRGCRAGGADARPGCPIYSDRPAPRRQAKLVNPP